MGKRIFKVSLPERPGEYVVALDKLSKFLCNDNSVMYFEYPERILKSITDETEAPKEESNLTQIRLLVIQDSDNIYIPDGYSYLCSYKDNAHIRYFIYLYDSLGGLFKSFFGNFGGIL